MSQLLINSDNRQLIPRWHTSRKMESMRLLNDSISSLARNNNFDYRIDQKEYIWKEEPSIDSAIELFLGLKMAGMTSDSSYDSVTKYLRSKSAYTTETLKDLLNPKLRMLDSSEVYETNEDNVYHLIARLKSIVRDYPNDSLTWSDLSFYYAVIGEKEKAENSMNIAYNLSNKHALLARSYARLLVHNDDPARALQVLRNTGNVKKHPELLSADISIRSSFDIGKPDISAARRLIDRYSSTPLMISELSASVGTIEIENGALKRGKLHLATSSLSPTENTIAQLKWLYQQHKILIPIADGVVHTKSIEANAIYYYNQKAYKECRQSLMKLHHFQPFSNGPLADSGYLSLIALDDPDYVIKFSEYYRQLLKSNVIAKNNYIVAKMEVGDLDNLDTMLADLAYLAKTETDKSMIIATIGMYLYQIGDIEGARSQYMQSKGKFNALKNSYTLAICLLYQAMAERKLGLDGADSLFAEAQREAEKLDTHPEVLSKIKREMRKQSTKK